MAGVAGVLTIDLGNFKQEDRQQLTSFLRGSIPEAKQIGWQQLQEQFANTPETRQRSIRARLLLMVLFGVHVVAFGIIWAMGGGAQYLIFACINAMLATYLLRSCRHKQTESRNIVGKAVDAGAD